MANELSNQNRAMREANMQMRWEIESLIEWYRSELDRVERLADRQSPAVRETLSWSLPWLRGVVAGTIQPVWPRPESSRSDRRPLPRGAA